MQRGDVFARRYVVEEVVGRGASGVVTRVRDRVADRVVALKTLDAGLAAEPSSRARFLREARSAAGIDHPHVVRVLDVGEDEGVPFLTMPLLTGGDLKSRLRTQHRLDPVFTAVVLEQVAAGLDAAHGQGLVHRDVKPANIVFGRDGTAIVCDFGLAKPLDGSDDFTSTGYALGTAAYMAPEQVTGGELSARTDVYALGCVAYHCLAGSPPFTGDSPVQVASARTTGPAPSLGVARPDLPRSLVAAVDRALALRPDDRWDSAGELAAAVRRAVAAPREQRAEPVPTVVEQTAPLPLLPLEPTAEPVVRGGRPRRGALLGAAAVLVATLAGGGLGLASGGEPDEDRTPRTPEQALEALLPTEVFRDCTPQPAGEGMTAALTCRSAEPGTDEILVRRFDSPATMAAAFVDRTVGKYTSAPCSQFTGGPKGSGHRSTWGPDKAPLACYVNDNAHAVVLWEHPQQAVQLLAIRTDAASPDLFRWWQRAKDVPLRQ